MTIIPLNESDLSLLGRKIASTIFHLLGFGVVTSITVGMILDFGVLDVMKPSSWCCNTPEIGIGSFTSTNSNGITTLKVECHIPKIELEEIELADQELSRSNFQL